MLKTYSVLVEADAWINVEADSDSAAEEEAKRTLESNPFGWDEVRCTIMGEPTEVEE